ESQIAAFVMKTNILSTVLLGSLLVGACFAGCRTRCGLPPTKITVKPEQVTGSWVGFTDWHGAFYKLELVARGTGHLRRVLSKSGTTAGYDIAHWQIDQPT